jgi:sulfonate transport system substrate-binding protein
MAAEAALTDRMIRGPRRRRSARAWTLTRMVVAVALAALPTAAAAQDVTLRVGHFPNITHVQALVARHFERQGRNWYAERIGARIEWYAYNAGPSAMEAMFAASIDLTYVGPNPALNAYVRSRGDEVRVVAGAVNGASALVVQGDGALAKAADFKGKKIGTPQFGNTQDVAARAWLAAGGLKVTQTGGDAHVLPTANADQLGLFMRKQLDAVWTVEPWVSRLEMEGGGKVLVEEKDAVTTVLVARARFLAERRDMVRRFVTAHRELTGWIAQNAAEAQRMAREELRAAFRSDFSAELIARSWSRMAPTADVSLVAFEAFVRHAQQVGFLRNVPDLSRLVEAP